MFDQIIKAHKELEEINDGIIAKQETIIVKQRELIETLKNHIEELRQIIETILSSNKKTEQ